MPEAAVTIMFAMESKGHTQKQKNITRGRNTDKGTNGKEDFYE